MAYSRKKSTRPKSRSGGYSRRSRPVARKRRAPARSGGGTLRIVVEQQAPAVQAVNTGVVPVIPKRSRF